MFFYTDTEEIPKANKPSGIQEVFETFKGSATKLGSVGMHIANVKLSHCEAKFCRVWAKIWACTAAMHIASGRVRRKKPNLPGLGVKIRLKNGQLNDPVRQI